MRSLDCGSSSVECGCRSRTRVLVVAVNCSHIPIACRTGRFVEVVEGDLDDVGPRAPWHPSAVHARPDGGTGRTDDGSGVVAGPADDEVGPGVWLEPRDGRRAHVVTTRARTRCSGRCSGSAARVSSGPATRLACRWRRPAVIGDAASRRWADGASRRQHARR
jgi:hypothetical protein